MDGLSWFTQYNYLLSIIKGVPAIFPSFSHHFPICFPVFFPWFSIMSHHFPVIFQCFPSFPFRFGIEQMSGAGTWTAEPGPSSLPIFHFHGIPMESQYLLKRIFSGKIDTMGRIMFIYIIFTILLSLWLSNNNIMCILTIIIYYCHYIYSVNNNNNNNDNNNGNNNNNDMYVYMSI